MDSWNQTLHFITYTASSSLKVKSELYCSMLNDFIITADVPPDVQELLMTGNIKEWRLGKNINPQNLQTLENSS